MKLLLVLATCLGLANLATAQVSLTEDFDSGTWPPAGWTVVDNSPTASAPWNTSSAFNRGNLTTGTGECAVIDSDFYGIGVAVDGELISPPFDVPGPGYVLQFDQYFLDYQAEIADVDISVNGGAWTNLVSYSGSPVQEITRLPLDAYAGMTNLQVRFHYWNAAYEWYWHVDDVVVEFYVPRPSVWEEDFDSGVWPPAGWTVLDNTPTAAGSWETSSFFNRGNLTAGSGECAAIDSDFYGGPGGAIPTDGELITPAFNVPQPGCTFEFTYLYDEYSQPESAELDVSVDGGPWTLVKAYTVFSSGIEVVDMDPYLSATTVEFRFHYVANWDWYWHVDDVGLFLPSGSGPGTEFCSDAVHTCPCFVTSAIGEGCPNSTGPGATLAAAGSPSIGASTFSLTAAQLPATVGLFVQGTNAIGGADGNPVGEGRLCLGPQKRYQPQSISGGAVTRSNFQNVATAGGAMNYQFWFRDPSNTCAGGGFNFSPAYNVTWLP